MEELGGKSFTKSIPDWDTVPIQGAMLAHGKDMYHTSESLNVPEICNSFAEI